jgi:hypothetical protein
MNMHKHKLVLSYEKVGMVCEDPACNCFFSLAEIKEAMENIANETCDGCKLKFTSSCPSLLGVKCQYFQPKGIA